MAVHQPVERLLGKALGVTSDPRVGRAPAHQPDDRDVARGQVANWLGDDDSLASRGQHVIDDPLRVGQKVIEACLHDRHIGLRQPEVDPVQVEVASVDTGTPQPVQEPIVDVEAYVAADVAAQVPQIERARAAAQLHDRGPVGDLLGDRAHPVSVMAAVQRAHQKLVAGRASVDEARLGHCLAWA